MLSRSFCLATVMLLIGWAVPVHAQNLEAGKSPSQIFSSTCNVCHKSPRGLLKTVPPGSLAGFLQEHYTTSVDMASKLSAFVMSNGAADPRAAGQQARDPKQEPRPSSAPDRSGGRLHPESVREAAGPEDRPPNESGRPGRNSGKLARPKEHPDAGKPTEGQLPVRNATEHSQQGLEVAKPQLGNASKRPAEKMGDPAKDDLGKTEATRAEPPKEDPAKTEPVNGEQPKADTAKAGGKETEDPKAPGDVSSESAKIQPAKLESTKEKSGEESPALSADSVSVVKPSVDPATSAAAVPVEANGSGAVPAPSQPAAPAAVAAPRPSLPPVMPAGPPAPPISQ